MEKKYLVIGGGVKSKNDGDIHYINAQRLCELYGVNPQECVLVEENSTQHMRGYDFQKQTMIVLRPRFDGNYGLVNGRPK